MHRTLGHQLSRQSIVQLNGACDWTPHIVRWAVVVALIWHVCATHSIPLSHSIVCSQICAYADDDVLVPHVPFEPGVAQYVCAVVLVALPQHT